MSLRGLYQYLQLKSPTYLVRDGRHVFVYWRRADHVHARAKEYLQAKMPGIRSADMRAAQACQDLVDLNLLRCMENNEQKKWVSSDKSLRSIYYAAEFLRWRLTCGSAVFSGDHVIVLSISWIPARVEGRRDNSAQVSDGRRNLLVFKLRTPFLKELHVGSQIGLPHEHWLKEHFSEATDCHRRRPFSGKLLQVAVAQNVYLLYVCSVWNFLRELEMENEALWQQ